MLKDLRIINQKRRDLEDQYAPLKKDLATVKVFQRYKCIKGDDIDRLMMEALNRANINLPVKRLDIGRYLFGSRTITAKIINGKLLIRVGGGYMNVDEFIDQYGKVEMLKHMKAQGDPMADKIIRQGGAARHSVVGNDVYKMQSKGELTENLMSSANVYQESSSRQSVVKMESSSTSQYFK